MSKTLLAILLLPTVVSAGKFNCGKLSTSSEQVTLQVPRPPDAYPQIKSIKVEIVGADKNFKDLVRLKAQIEQALARDFNVDAPKADAHLRATVVAYDAPTVTTHVQTENRSVAVGNSVQNQNVPVTYWIGSGRLSLRVQMVDADQVPMDTFDPDEVYRVTREAVVRETGPAAKKEPIWMHIPKLPTGKKADTKPEEAAAVTGKEMTPAEINAAMLDTVALKIRRRYVRSTDEFTFKLACDDDLRAGNRMAMGSSPDWEKATKLWTDARVIKNEGDRAYNLAVAQEALAYKAYEATLNPADAVPFFEKAMALYEKSQQLDPSEKYIHVSAERLNVARTNIARAIDQRKLWESERDRARESFIAKREGSKSINAKRQDSPKETSYRQLVRASLSGDPKRDLSPMRATGEKLGLNEVEVQRIITQETDRLQGLSQYEAMVAQMVADGVLTKEERQGLNSFYPTLNMTPADAKSVESKFKFTEVGVGRTAPPQAATAPDPANLKSTRQGPATTKPRPPTPPQN